MTAAKRATAKRLSLDSVAMRLAKAESMPGKNEDREYLLFRHSFILSGHTNSTKHGLNNLTCAGLNLEHGRRFSGSQASLASSTLTIATNPPPATTREYAGHGGMHLTFIFHAKF